MKLDKIQPMKKNIPNYLTSLNLLSGIFAIYATTTGSLSWAVIFIIIAAILDFMDGALARLLKVSSELGKQLDSLADLVSFGLAPGFIMFVLLKSSHPLPEIYIAKINLLALIAFFLPLFSAWRLAKFNIDPRQEGEFIGLPTPANALMVASLALMNQHILSPISWMVELTSNSIFLLCLTLLLCILQVAELPLLSLKFKNLSWNGNKSRFILLFISIILLIVFQVSAIPIILLLYVLISTVNNK